MNGTALAGRRSEEIRAGFISFHLSNVRSDLLGHYGFLQLLLCAVWKRSVAGKASGMVPNPRVFDDSGNLPEANRLLGNAAGGKVTELKGTIAGHG